MTRFQLLIVWIALAAWGCEGSVQQPGDDDPGDDDIVVGDDDASDDDAVDDDDDAVDDDDDAADDDDAGADVWCWTVAATNNGAMAVIEVDVQTGTWSLVGEYGSGLDGSLRTEGIARLGESLILSAHLENDHHFIEIDMGAEVVTVGSEASSASLSVSAGELIRVCGGSLCRYPDFAALDSSSPSSLVPASFWGERIAGTDTEIYVSWHSTEELDIHDAFNACWMDDIELENWDGWVHGMSVVGDRIYLIGSENRVAGFDRHTGTLLVDHTMPLDEYPGGASGLWCEAR